jgi:hypothetical protein
MFTVDVKAIRHAGGLAKRTGVSFRKAWGLLHPLTLLAQTFLVTDNVVTLLGWLKMRSSFVLRRRVGGPPTDLFLDSRRDDKRYKENHGNFN